MKNNQLTKLPVILNVGVLGLLAGLCCAVQFGLVPVLNHLDAPAYLTIMQGIIPTFTHLVIPLVIMGFMTFLYRLTRFPARSSRSYAITFAAFILFVAGMAITVAGHFPLNHQIAGWTAQNLPSTWEVVRLKWAQLNFWRFAVALLSFLAGVAPLLCTANSSSPTAIMPDANATLLDKLVHSER